VLGHWVDWAGGRGETTLADIDKATMAEYAGYLRQRVNARQSTETDDTSGITASTAWAYYDNVSAFLDHCLKWDKITENPAQKEISKDELPERPSANSSNQQFWSPTERRALLDHVDRVASEAIDDRGTGAVVELRDKGAGVCHRLHGRTRGEILADSRDDRRNGIRWSDVDIENNQIDILGKNQQRESVQLPGQTHRPLEQLKRAVDPTSDDWPVFISSMRRRCTACCPMSSNARMTTSEACSTTVEPLGLCRQHCLQTALEAS